MWDPVEATSPSNLGKGLQAAGAETPLHQGTTQLEQQDPSSASEAKTRPLAESGTESPSIAHAATEPPAQLSTPSPRSPDFSLSVPFELTKAVSTGRVDEPQNSNQIKNSQEGNHAASGANSDAAPGGTSASFVQYLAQTEDIETGSSVHDTKQVDTSVDKRGGEAAQDSTKVADGKGGLPKANADPALTPQLVPEGRAEAGRASSEVAGASPGRGEAGSANVLEGYQANAETVVRSARFTQQAGNAEMQVRLRSEALGPIDVHTIVKGSDIGASIRVEARDTQVMLANELSQLERALNERSLRVEHLDVLQGSVSGDQSNGTGSGNSHGSPSEPRQSLSRYSAGQTYTSLPEAPTVSEDWGLGLSITRINLRV
jgi:flagellar hook-length control protein FliK